MTKRPIVFLYRASLSYIIYYYLSSNEADKMDTIFHRHDWYEKKYKCAVQKYYSLAKRSHLTATPRLSQDIIFSAALGRTGIRLTFFLHT